jgi:hypothetical protein
MKLGGGKLQMIKDCHLEFSKGESVAKMLERNLVLGKLSPLSRMAYPARFAWNASQSSVGGVWISVKRSSGNSLQNANFEGVILGPSATHA